MGFIFALFIALLLIFVGLFAGTFNQRRHLASLISRESDSRDFLVTDLRSFSHATTRLVPTIVTAEVVISADYFKTFVANLKKLIVGELGIYLRLTDRARREAVIRLIEQARAQGYNAICNLRIDSADIGKNALRTRGNRGRPAAMVAVLASATAYHRDVTPASVTTVRASASKRETNPVRLSYAAPSINPGNPHSVWQEPQYQQFRPK